MRCYKRELHLTWLQQALFILALFSLAPGCSGTPQQAVEPAVPFSRVLGWPPPGGPARTALNAELFAAGRDYSATGGGSSPAGDALHLDGSGGLAWAVYTFEGLSGAMYPISLTVNASGDQTGGGGATLLYIGVSDYSRQAWTWYPDSVESFGLDLQAGPALVSPGGATSIAAVLYGPGTAELQAVRLTLSINPPPPPANLVAAAEFGVVGLDWDDEPEAAGFNVYRCMGPALLAPLKLNSELITASEYLDDKVTDGVIYCYYVTAWGDGESAHSNVADIFTPATDLPAPENPSVLERTAVNATVGWDWPGLDPADFAVLVGTVPDFGLSEVVSLVTGISGDSRTTVLESLEPGATYYWRVAARDTIGYLGRMSDDLPVSLTGYWIWEERLVGAGDFPAALATDTRDIAAAYTFENAVYFATARPDSGGFTSLPTPLDATIDGAGFDEYLDMAWSGDEFLLASQSKASQDLYAAVGSPAAGWTLSHIHGDGAVGGGHARSGYGIRVACEGALNAVLHQDRTQNQLLLHTLTAGDSTWSTTTVCADNNVPSSHSLALDGSGAHVVWFDAILGQLNYYWSGDGFVPHPAGSMGRYNDLALVGGVLMTPAYDSAGDLYILRDDAGTWSSALVADQSVPVGLGAQLVPDGAARAFLVYRDDVANIEWYLAVYDGAFWSSNRIAIQGVGFGIYIRLACLNGVPFILYTDPMRPDSLYCARGTPPAP